jgi:hypothetical protein
MRSTAESRFRRFKARIVCTVGGAGLLAGGIAGVAPAILAAAQVTDAVSTTVDQTVDGTTTDGTAPDGTGTGLTICQNGNPNVNCNIYAGKFYVWLSGLQSTTSAGLRPGTYFFDVLVPGGQPSPNDVSPNVSGDSNLSDDFDAYTDRTFTINADGSFSYSGPHNKDLANNKIRLWPYDTTTNPGGVYIMAVCSLAKGYPVDPKDCKYDAFKVRSTSECVSDCGGLSFGNDPVPTKDANDTFTWTVGKSVDKTVVKQIGGNATFNYTITATPDAGSLAGTIDVFNPNGVTVALDSVSDVLSDNTVCPVDTSGNTQLALAPGDNFFPYTCPSTDSTLTNTVTVYWSFQTLGNGDVLCAEPDFQTPIIGGCSANFGPVGFTLINDCVTVTDLWTSTSTTTTLGEACQDGSWTTDSGNALASFTHTYVAPTFTLMYSRTVPVPANGCVQYTNTATLSTDTTQTGPTNGPQSVAVQVCGPTSSGALTLGFWKNSNGQNLIKYYCAPAGTSLYTYLTTNLAPSGAGNGPFSDVPTNASCTQLASYVSTVLTNVNATNMNSMLKAQMLTTSLDVYFSSYGYTSTAIKVGGTTYKAPSNFLPNGGIGTYVMDLTAICPMVDNLSTGTGNCTKALPGTNGYSAGAVPCSGQSINGLLNYAATMSATSPTGGALYRNKLSTNLQTDDNWYNTNTTDQTILKNAFDQFNNNLAFAGTAGPTGCWTIP